MTWPNKSMSPLYSHSSGLSSRSLARKSMHNPDSCQPLYCESAPLFTFTTHLDFREQFRASGHEAFSQYATRFEKAIVIGRQLKSKELAAQLAWISHLVEKAPFAGFRIATPAHSRGSDLLLGTGAWIASDAALSKTSLPTRPHPRPAAPFSSPQLAPPSPPPPISLSFTSSPSPQPPEPTIQQTVDQLLANIRAVLVSADPAEAEDLIAALQRLPPDEQTGLLDTTGNAQDRDAAEGPLADGHAAGGDAGVQLRASDSVGPPKPQKTSKKGQKRGRLGTHDGQDQASGDDSDNDDDKGKDKKKKPRRNRRLKWRCPFGLADPQRYPACAVLMLSERSACKLHLYEVHDLDDDQKDRIETIVSSTFARGPRDDRWLEWNRDCFVAIWRVCLPGFAEPLFPFVDLDDTASVLAARARSLLLTHLNVRAERAVTAGRVASVNQYQPTLSELLDLMSTAISTTQGFDRVPLVQGGSTEDSDETFRWALCSHPSCPNGAKEGFIKRSGLCVVCSPID